MIEKYAIATTPGISLTFPKPLDAEDASFFAGGISHAVQGFSGLPGVPSELDKLEDQHGATILHNEAFQLSTIETQLGSEDYSIVHIATHGHFDSNPQQSYLLTYDGKLTMDLLEQSIGSRRQTGNTLDLLVLSACETAVGDNRAALGLAGVALKAGARSAVATLWQISDAATVLIVGSFYEYTSKGNRNKAEALRSAQIKLIDSERYSHPSDWAPFLLIGNWLL
jgi:CHAT domain-containing protein